MKLIVFPKPSLLKRLIEAIKEALQYNGNRENREQRRRKEKLAGRKNPDGKLYGSVTFPKAIKDAKLIREIKGK